MKRILFIGCIGAMAFSCMSDFDTPPKTYGEFLALHNSSSSSDELSSSSDEESSSSMEESSSSTAPSSSSIVISSSSSVKPSSSSVALSSSSVKPSSSSVAPSSSSIVPSSSSSAPPPISYGNVSHGGKSYKTVVIGTQTWMAENLKYETTKSLCYKGSADSCNTYGRLYNWEEAKSNCPSEWRLPNDTDWELLINTVKPDAGNKLKATNHWTPGSDTGTDDYGFSALPGGDCNNGCVSIGNNGSWWSSTEYDVNNAKRWYMSYNSPNVNNGSIGKSYFLSVRCVIN